MMRPDDPMRPKLNQMSVRIIRDLYRAGASGKDLAFLYGVSKSTISGLINNKTWKDSRWQAELLSFDPRSPTRSPGAGTASYSTKA